MSERHSDEYENEHLTITKGKTPVQTYDQSRVPDTTLDDLDSKSIERHIDYARTSGRYVGDARSVEEFLIEHAAAVRVGDDLVPTIAGMLIFSRWPQRSLPQATVTVAHYRGQDINSGDVIHMQEYTGPVTEQIDRVVTYLTSSMRHGYVLAGSAQRQELPQYPILALRELTVNAIAHRDYTISTSSVRIAMFHDRIEWTSPGALPEGVTIQTILEEQNARNPRLMRLLYQQSYVERFGQGLDTVFAECEKLGLPIPTMRETGTSFTIGLVGHEVVGSNRSRANLTETQLQIVTVLQQHGSLSAQEITDAINQGGRAVRSLRSVQVDLKVLVEAEVVDRRGQARASSYSLRAF
jgi:ATP-dependent DNA helicase RecG